MSYMPDRPWTPGTSGHSPPSAPTPAIRSRKQEMAKEDSSYHLFRLRGSGNPDPDRSKLCEECDEFIKNLHGHPWKDATKVTSPIGISHISNRGYTEQAGWRSLAPLYRTSLDRCLLCILVRDVLVKNNLICEPGLLYEASSDTFKKLPAYWEPIEQREPRSYRLIPTKYGKVYDLDPRRTFGQVSNQIPMLHDRWSLGVEIKHQSSKESCALLPCAVHCASRPVQKFSPQATSETPFEQRPILHGRQRELVCDIGLLKSWIKICNSSHGRECSERSNDELTLRLVDVYHNNLVMLRHSPSHHVEYVALSYIWGDREQRYAPSADLYTALHDQKALEGIPLSRTVRDAIDLVRKMGLRYLWVDALCIQQTSAVDKHHQIAQMGSVYQNAAFTIVAAAGTNCDAGLPGLRRGTRFEEQTIVQAGDYALMNALQTPANKILTAQTSKWVVRGWTLQEDLLSSKQLIFTAEHIWWRCACATWCEDSQLETTDPVGFMLEGEHIKPRLQDRFATLEPKQYFEIVIDYAQRHLSYPSDGLNAFSGILTMLTKYSNHRFLWGLMLADFERQLHWFGSAKVRPGTQPDAFPTWSWVSYQGEISFIHYLTYEPLIQCHVIHEINNDYQIVPVRDLYGRPIQNSVSPTKQGKPVTIQDVQKRYPSESFTADFHVFFYSYSATFYLEPYGRLRLPHLQEQGEQYTSFQQPDYGYLIPSLGESELCEHGERECVLLGRRPRRSEHDAPHVVVMLVERTGGILRRLGIADLPEQFWDKANKAWDLVVLG